MKKSNGCEDNKANESFFEPMYARSETFLFRSQLLVGSVSQLDDGEVTIHEYCPSEFIFTAHDEHRRDVHLAWKVDHAGRRS